MFDRCSAGKHNVMMKSLISDAGRGLTAVDEKVTFYWLLAARVRGGMVSGYERGLSL
jgi:hypothetical protein